MNIKKLQLAVISVTLVTALTSCYYDEAKGLELIAGWWYMAEASEDTTIICKPCPIEMRFTQCLNVVEECPCTTILRGKDTTFYTSSMYALSEDGAWLKFGKDSFYLQEINAKEIVYGSAPGDSITWRNVLKRP